MRTPASSGGAGTAFDLGGPGLLSVSAYLGPGPAALPPHRLRAAAAAGVTALLVAAAAGLGARHDADAAGWPDRRNHAAAGRTPRTRVLDSGRELQTPLALSRASVGVVGATPSGRAGGPGTAAARRDRPARAARLGKPLDRTRRELVPLLALTMRPGRAFSGEQRLDLARPDRAEVFDGTFDGHVKNIRTRDKAVAPEGALIRSACGVGRASAA